MATDGCVADVFENDSVVRPIEAAVRAEEQPAAPVGGPHFDFSLT